MHNKIPDSNNDSQYSLSVVECYRVGRGVGSIPRF